MIELAAAAAAGGTAGAGSSSPTATPARRTTWPAGGPAAEAPPVGPRHGRPPSRGGGPDAGAPRARPHSRPAADLNGEPGSAAPPTRSDHGPAERKDDEPGSAAPPTTPRRGPTGHQEGVRDAGASPSQPRRAPARVRGGGPGVEVYRRRCRGARSAGRRGSVPRRGAAAGSRDRPPRVRRTAWSPRSGSRTHRSPVRPRESRAPVHWFQGRRNPSRAPVHRAPLRRSPGWVGCGGRRRRARRRSRWPRAACAPAVRPGRAPGCPVRARSVRRRGGRVPGRGALPCSMHPPFPRARAVSSYAGRSCSGRARGEESVRARIPVRLDRHPGSGDAAGGVPPYVRVTLRVVRDGTSTSPHAGGICPERPPTLR